MPERKALVERTLDEKLAMLLEQTSQIAVQDARARTRRVALVVVGVVVTLVLGGLVSIQAQLMRTQDDQRHIAYSRCLDRNRQAGAILHLLASSNSATQSSPLATPERKAAAARDYDRFIREYGPAPDCTVYL